MSVTAFGGSIDSPGSPSIGSGMYSMSQVYDYIISGNAMTAQTGFQEPSSAPGSTMKTMKEIGDALKSSFEQCNVTADNVELGKTFFCTLPGSWGVQTGKVCIAGTPTPTPTSTPTATPDWYAQYGPGGGDKVVRIGSMYVAKWTNNAGEANNIEMNWAAMLDWAAGLEWLGKDDWREPSLEEAQGICPAEAQLGAHQPYWYTTTPDGNNSSNAFYVTYSDGVAHSYPKNYITYVRAIRTAD
ncbi:MAG: hypothetical protein NTZ78_07935 [Candidatus Aureabacteria bacterium]|nr:hypothetical protein [Candidatus Auribacterota bacterium]